MKIDELTDTQLALIADVRPFWVACHCPNWMGDNRPFWLEDHCSELMLTRRHHISDVPGDIAELARGV